jgi:predicted protein tyrosine phosphatase
VAPSIVITPYYELGRALTEHDVGRVVSILGAGSDRLPWPDVGERPTLRLAFDDTHHSTGALVAPTRQDIDALIAFARDWRGEGTLLVHCRAGSSRSPAAAMIAPAAIGRLDIARLVPTAKSYFRPHRGCLSLADAALATTLVGLAEKPAPTCTDNWAPVALAL